MWKTAISADFIFKNVFNSPAQEGVDAFNPLVPNVQKTAN